MAARHTVEQFRHFFGPFNPFTTAGSEGRRQALVERSQHGGLKRCRVRSVAWRVFFGLLPLDKPVTDWKAIVESQREQYAAIKAENTLDPTEEATDPLLDNPLSQDENSAWTRAHQDRELREEVGKDLERLYPNGMDEYFEDKGVQHMMMEVLFLWARTHGDTSYRQGMHELLAPIVYVLRTDAVPADAEGGEGTEEEEMATLRTLLPADPAAQEADAFLLFRELMGEMEPMFAVQSAQEQQAAVKDQQMALKRFQSGIASQEEMSRAVTDVTANLSPLLALCTRVQHNGVRQADPALYRHLTSLGIEPQIYAMKWVRLMFAREFHMEDVLLLWDGFFAARFESGSQTIASTLERVSVAMVLFVREFLMTHDYAHSLRRLLRFPPVEDVTTFLDCARLLRKDPTRPFPEPKTQQLLQKRRGGEAGAAGAETRGATAPPPGAGGYVPGGDGGRPRAGAPPVRRSATAQAASALSGLGAALGGVRDRLSQPQQPVSAPQGPGSLFHDAFGPPRSVPPQPAVASARGMTMAEQLSHARKVQYNMAGHLERIVRSLEQAVWASSPSQGAEGEGSARDGTGAEGGGSGDGETGGADGGEGQEGQAAARSAAAQEDAVMRAVAELKQVKEVLRGRLEERDCFWEGQEVETPVEPAHGVHPTAPPAQGQARGSAQSQDRVTGPSVFATAEGLL